MTTPSRHLPVLLALAGLLVGQGVAEAQDLTPQAWLDRMSTAVASTNYEGTVIRLQNGEVQALKVARMVKDGVIHEKLMTQEGDGLEIIRNGNEVHRILPDQQTVLVEQWDVERALFSTLPSAGVTFGNEYDVSIVREARVAGHRTVVLAIRPHDEFRYGHRLWLEAETGFPLQTRLLGENGEAIEQVKFADIRFDQDLSDAALAPSTSTENFRWFTRPQRAVTADVDSPWDSDALPSGFRAISTHNEGIAGRDADVIHILYSDGLANVSVFIEPVSDKKIAKRSRIGSSNSYSTRYEGFQVTAVGEVPAATVEQIATSMRPQ